MSLLDEEFYCEKCNWFTYRHSPIPYVKPAPRCPRCGAETHVATVEDVKKKAGQVDYDWRTLSNFQQAGWSFIDPNGVGHTVQHFHDEVVETDTTTDLKKALAMTRDFVEPMRRAIVPRKTVLKQAEISNRRCRECKIVLLTNSDTGLCDICLTMFNAIASQPGLREAHIAWEVENQRRITHKQRLMRD